MKRDTRSILGWGGAALITALGLVGPWCAGGFSQGADSSSARLHQQQGIAYLNQHNLPKALEEFRAAVRLGPADPASHDYLGIALAESGQNEEAAKEFEAAARLADDFAQAHFHLALAYDQLGRNSEAIMEYEATLRLEPNALDARYALSADCWKRGDWEGAIQLLRQVIIQNPSFAAEAHYNLGLELKQVGKLDEAARELKTAASLQPDSVKFLIGLCQTLTENLDFDGAIASAKKAIQLAPDNPEPFYDFAEASRLKGDLDTAEAQFNRASELGPKFPRVHRQLGLVLRQKGSYEAAAAQLQQAVHEDPDDAEVLYYLGSILLKLNDTDRAIENLNESVRLNPYDSAAHITLAGVLNRVGRAQDAQQELKKAQVLDELKANAGSSRILLGSAEEHLNNDEFDAALGDLHKAIELSPEYTEAHFQLARALQKKGAPPSDVEKVERRVIELKPDYAQAHLQLGLLLARMGQKDEAFKELRRASDLAPSLVEAHRALGKIAQAAHDWRTAISEFGAILVWKEEDREARRDLSLALAQRKQHQK